MKAGIAEKALQLEEAKLRALRVWCRRLLQTPELGLSGAVEGGRAGGEA